MGVELELSVLLLLQLCATSLFGRFEAETPTLKKIAKWIVFSGVTVSLYFWIGHLALCFPLLMLLLGTIVHFHICKKHGFDPLDATPRRRYYEFRGWKWME